MTTVMDIARRSGFSTATVSRAFNGTASVHQSTHDKIMAVARELGDYQWGDAGGSTGARPMGRPRGSLSTDYYRHIIEGAASVLSAHGRKAVQKMRCEQVSPSFNPTNRKIHINSQDFWR